MILKRIPLRYKVTPFLLTAVLLFGCNSGEDACPVFGKVTFQGKPVAQGMVRFCNSAGGFDVFGILQPDGTYAIQTAKGNGLPAGVYVVAVVPPRVEVPLGAMTPPVRPKCLDIPERYRDLATSGLTLTVGPGTNRFDIDMR